MNDLFASEAQFHQNAWLIKSKIFLYFLETMICVWVFYTLEYIKIYCFRDAVNIMYHSRMLMVKLRSSVLVLDNAS